MGRAIPEKRHKILLVEDDPGNILVQTTFLESMGYDYDIASTSVEVIEKFWMNSYSLILMDLSLPQFQGITMTKQLRRMEKSGTLANTPIIAITAHAFATDRTKCLNAGMDDYLSKPFTYEGFRTKIQQHIC